MDDPYKVLGLPGDSDDETIRRRYLELVKQNPPDRSPEKFAAVRSAYEQLRDITTRVRHRVFEAGKQDTIDAIIQEATCQSNRPRASLQTLLSLVRKA